ncbi:MAG: hypothetical protein ACRDZP_07185, partial [Acidimicrobiales bacterium]
MPNVLAKLGGDVLVANPHVSTPGVLSFDRKVHAERLGELVRSSGAHLGAMLDPDGEQLTLVDDSGRILSDEEALCVFVAIVCEQKAGTAIAVPVDAPTEVARIAEAAGSELIWTKLAASELMAASSEPAVRFAGNTQGGFIFPGFLPAFDAVAALVHLLSLLAVSGSRLSQVGASLTSPEMVRLEVPTPFEAKGLVMRMLLERSSAEEIVLVDGVKLVDHDGWSLVVPDAEGPSTIVTAEGATAAAALERANAMAEQITAIISETTS